MRMALCTALGLAWLAGAGGHPSRTMAPSPHPTDPDSAALASKLVGKWMGARYDSGSTAPHQFRMSWKRASDGELTGMVAPTSGQSYVTKVVWSSDTGFVTESAPHKSGELGEQVVTRTVSHLKGDSLWGTFELRPMSYKGRSEQGHFSAARQK